MEKSFATADQQWVPASGVDDAARVFLIQQALAEKLAPGKSTTEQATVLQKYFADLSKEIGVSVSPRYGSWDAAKVAVVAPLNDLSSPAASASACAVRWLSLAGRPAGLAAGGRRPADLAGLVGAALG